MLNFNQFKSQNIGIYGLGITGSSIAETLKFNGANVYVWDDNPEIRRKYIGLGRIYILFFLHQELI